jgi:tetratricopeptide (TPR) repeat protein
MILPFLLQAAAPADPLLTTTEVRFERCVDAATADGAAGAQEASRWASAGGGFLAQQCLGLANTTARDFAGAGRAFEAAARAAELAKDKRAANYWAQAGNAWLAAGDVVKARGALDAALASGTLEGLPMGEAYLDRARARVAAEDPAGARTDLDKALVAAADDPLAWLLSATLARRTGDLPRATKDIAEAVRRAPDDASVQLEAGNIAALTGDEPGARGGWQKAAQLAGDGPVALSARTALAQFDAGK